MKEKSMNEKKSTNWTAKKLAINALAIALVCVSTMVIQIPIPLGYMHLGNCCILLVSVYFGNMTGMQAALAPVWQICSAAIHSGSFRH